MNWTAALIGFARGCVSGLTGVGGGHVDQKIVRPLRRGSLPGIVHAVALNRVAGMGRASLGHVQFGLHAAFLVGTLPGNRPGARLTKPHPDKQICTLPAGPLLAAG